MTSRRHALFAAAALPAAGGAAAAAPVWPDADEIARRVAEVSATETAFAAAFVARDLARFRSFLAPDTIWMGKQPLHGPDAVMQAWNAWLTAPQPPFSWGPDLALVLPSGELARTSGPVRDPDGRQIGRFQSTWRRKPAGGWEIVFDFGT
ncbi:MAG: nuclear transport factor 2 family protein [Comamonadaceae bacterium]|jgi:ketosteroid isomerase-like protein|nr:nuclear transport factor 2 family protein [Comamonadaceae bacterium]